MALHVIVYARELRIREPVGLQLNDISREGKLLYIREGKRLKASRVSMTLKTLEKYSKRNRPKIYVFEDV